jgi:hypothetical protein
MKAQIDIMYSLPSNVTLLGGKLMQHSAEYAPEFIECAARTVRGKRCKNYLDPYRQVTYWYGTVKLGGHVFNVREADEREFTPDRLDRWKRQLCACHYDMRETITYAVRPQWTLYDPAGDIAKMSRISALLDELQSAEVG